nr:MAG TPA: hypothetical protein [Caudoviricetes sp.]
MTYTGFVKEEEMRVYRFYERSKNWGIQAF